MEHKQNVLLVHNYYQIPGGEDTVVANEMKLLQEQGHKIVFYSRNNKELKTMNKIQMLLLPFSTVFNLKTYYDIKRIIKKQKIEIVHVHNTLNLISPSVYYAALICHVPVVQTIHNYRLLCPAATFYRDGHICEDCITEGLGCAIQHKCYRKSKLQTLACVINTKIHRLTGIYGKINYICLTDFNKKKLLNIKQIQANKVFVKPNFVKEESLEIQNRNGYVFVGRLEEIKGVKELIQAWHCLGNDAPLLKMCGTGPLMDECVNYVRENHIDNIEILGFVEHEELKKIIAKSKFLILPTRVYEGFPMTIIEAFSQGTPVIVPDMGNAGGLVEEGVNGFKYKTNSLDAFVQCIRKSMGADDLEKNTLEIYKNKYTDTINGELLESIYKQVEEYVG